MVAESEEEMTNEKKFEKGLAEATERRVYEPPTVRDFFQPLVVLGTTMTNGGACQATPRAPKH